jgi:hypothetical protein
LKSRKNRIQTLKIRLGGVQAGQCSLVETEGQRGDSHSPGKNLLQTGRELTYAREGGRREKRGR